MKVRNLFKILANLVGIAGLCLVGYYSHPLAAVGLLLFMWGHSLLGSIQEKN